jgi:hypothetical protein
MGARPTLMPSSMRGILQHCADRAADLTSIFAISLKQPSAADKEVDDSIADVEVLRNDPSVAQTPSITGLSGTAQLSSGMRRGVRV